MSSGTFSDKAKEHHIKQINRQKRIVFGERPTAINAQTLRSTAHFNDVQDKSAITNQSGIGGSQMQGSTATNVSVVAQSNTGEMNVSKSAHKRTPWYILDAQSQFVIIFKIIISIIVVPNVLLNLYIMAFGYKKNEQLYDILNFSEIMFFLEILQNFFTSFSDPEHYDVVTRLRDIAQRYILNGSFLFHALAMIPWVIFFDKEDDEQLLRNLLLFKMLRITRLGASNFIPEDVLLDWMQKCYRNEHRDDKIANDRAILTVVNIFKMTLLTLIITYMLGLFWYRLSDHWQTFFIEDDPSTHWVVTVGLKVKSGEEDTFEPVSDMSALIKCMYYSLTTLSTVGYGDFYPNSIMEKIFGSIIQIFGVTFFSILMNKFQDIVVSMKGQNEGQNEQKLQQWFYLIRRIKN